VKIVRRQEAVNQGLLRYFTGKPCKYGHVVERLVSTNTCLECHRHRSRKRVLSGASAKAVSRYYKRNKEALNIQSQLYYKKHKTVLNKKAAIRDGERGYSANRRAAKLQAMPKWADKNAIRLVYANRPDGYHVDHIVPLIGKNVCGLHIAENLQYLSARDNLRKSNRLLS